MARPVVTEEVVAEVAEQLLQAGEKPSIIRIQALIGGGSFSTVKRHLETWKQRQAQAAPVEVPKEIAAQSAEFARYLWQAATTRAAKEAAQVREEAQREVAQARAASTEADQIIVRLEAEAEERDRQLEQARQERDEMRGQLEEERSAVKVAQARFEEQTQRLGDLQRQLESQAAEVAQARAELLAQARLAGEVEALRRQLSEQRSAPPQGDEYK